jgi:hypothetical protein
MQMEQKSRSILYKLVRFAHNWNIPTFHTAHQENGRKEYFESLRGVGSTRRGLYEPEADKL